MTPSVARSNAGVVGEVAGRAVTMRYASVELEYSALREGALLVDRSHRTRVSFEGERRADTLTGLVTNDVAALAPGGGLYAAALTPRGKIIADVRIFAREKDLVVDVPVRAGAGWTAMIRKYVNPRATRHNDLTESLADVSVVGPRAREIAATLAGVEAQVLGSLAPYGHVTGAHAGAELLVARVPDVGVEAYELLAPVASRPAVWQRATELGATPGGLDVWEIARVEAGRPEWGLDIDESTIPQEANLDELHAISYTKGCYTGQETVARVHFRGHVNRHLRGLRYPNAQPLPRGTQLFDEANRAVGDIRSAVVSPRLGGIALAMVRREVTPGTALRARWDDGESMVGVLTLPFPQ